MRIQSAQDVSDQTASDQTVENQNHNSQSAEKEPYYLPLNNELTLFQHAANNKLPVLLKGPTGCGKTRLVEHMAHELNRPLYTVACHDDLTATDLVGRHLVNHDGTFWQDGPLTKAVREGGICYLDEVVEARRDTTVVIHPLSDDRRYLPIDRTGELVKAHPDFLLVISYNPGYQSVNKGLKPSTRQRFVAVRLQYPNAEQETKVLIHETGLSLEVASKLVSLANELRRLKDIHLEEGLSTRMLIYAGRLLNSGLSMRDTLISCFCESLTDEEEDLNALYTWLELHGFGEL